MSLYKHVADKDAVLDGLTHPTLTGWLDLVPRYGVDAGACARMKSLIGLG